MSELGATPSGMEMCDVAVDTGNGALALFCSKVHAVNWKVANDCEAAPLVAPPSVLDVDTCAHCAWCGERVVDPWRCLVHGEDGCPRSDWLSSRWAGQFARGLAGLAELNGYAAEVPDGAWAFADSALQHGMFFPSPTELVEFVWSAHGRYWAPVETA